MPSPRVVVVRTNGGCSSPEAGAPAGSLPIAPLSDTSGGVAANGCSANRDRKRAASVDDCGDVAAPPGSAVLAPPGRHVADGPAPADGPVLLPRLLPTSRLSRRNPSTANVGDRPRRGYAPILPPPRRRHRHQRWNLQLQQKG